MRVEQPVPFDPQESLRWLRGEVPYPIDLQVRYLGRGKGPLPDFIVCSLFSPIVSGRFVATLQDAQASGWSRSPVTVITRMGPTTMYALLISGRAGPLDDARAVVKPVRLGNVVLTLPAGLFFREATWSGDDLFIPGDTALILATPGVAQILQAARLRGLDVTRCADSPNLHIGLP